MSKASRFEGLKDLAGGKEAQAARNLAESLYAVKAKEAQVQQLRDYLDEYHRSAAAEPQDAARWENSRRFLARLNEAVSLREGELEAAKLRYREEADRWRDAHVQTKALEQLVEKYYREELKALERREQKELDERAQRPKTRA